MAVSMIALGADFWLGGKGMVALVAMLVYTAGFAVSWGPVTWVLLSEIFPNQIRGKAMAVAVAAQWIANYLVSWSFPILDENPYLVEHFKHGFAYWIYGVMSILAALFMWRFVPETKGRSLEQMQKLWQPQMPRQRPLQLVDPLAGYGGDGVELQLAALDVRGQLLELLRVGGVDLGGADDHGLVGQGWLGSDGLPKHRPRRIGLLSR
jgi:hypothetical protein